MPTPAHFKLACFFSKNAKHLLADLKLSTSRSHNHSLSGSGSALKYCFQSRRTFLKRATLQQNIFMWQFVLFQTVQPFYLRIIEQLLSCCSKILLLNFYLSFTYTLSNFTCRHFSFLVLFRV